MFTKIAALGLALLSSVIITAASVPSKTPGGSLLVTLPQVRVAYDTGTPAQREVIDAAAKAAVMGSFSGWLMATANEKASTDDDTTTCFILARQMSGAELIQVAEYLTIKLKTIDGQDWRVVIGIALYAACVPHEEVGTQTPAMPQKKGKLLKT